MATYDLAYPGAAIDAILNTAYFLQEAGYIFQGSASEYSGTPSKRVWLIAPAGSTGFGLSSAVPQGSIGICLYNGTAWVGKVINVLTLDSAPTRNSQNGVTSGGVAATLDEIAGGIMETFASLLFDDETASADLRTKLSYAVKFSVSDVYQTVTHLNILAATTSKAGLMSAEDKEKVDSFLANLRSLTFADTTASADQGTKITETLKATIGGVQEVIDSITLLAATSSKAGLLSASDKAYIDALPATLTSLSNSISGALALMQSLVGYYVCDTAAGTAAKTVTATGYSLTNGGCIRIKMTNANTAANVTLNINSTGAKALYYDGAQASSTNTWEAGEVLEVYYDGTQYQCASGGGGKFATGEKVKDVSITDEVTDDSDAIVTSGAVATSIKCTEQISSFVRIPGQVKATNGNITNTSDSFYHTFEIPIGAYKVNFQAIKTTATNGVAFFNSSGTYISGYYNTTLPFGTRVTVDVPSNAKYFRYYYNTDAKAESESHPIFTYIEFIWSDKEKYIDYVAGMSELRSEVEDLEIKNGGITMNGLNQLNIAVNNATTGVVTYSTTSFVADIPIPTGSNMVDFQIMKTSATNGVTFLDGSGNVVGNYYNTTANTGTRVNIAIPANAVLFRYCYNTDSYATSQHFPLFDYILFTNSNSADMADIVGQLEEKTTNRNWIELDIASQFEMGNINNTTGADVSSNAIARSKKKYTLLAGQSVTFILDYAELRFAVAAWSRGGKYISRIIPFDSTRQVASYTADDDVEYRLLVSFDDERTFTISDMAGYLFNITTSDAIAFRGVQSALVKSELARIFNNGWIVTDNMWMGALVSSMDFDADGNVYLGCLCNQYQAREGGEPVLTMFSLNNPNVFHNYPFAPRNTVLEPYGNTGNNPYDGVAKILEGTDTVKCLWFSSGNNRKIGVRNFYKNTSTFEEGARIITVKIPVISGGTWDGTSFTTVDATTDNTQAIRNAFNIAYGMHIYSNTEDALIINSSIVYDGTYYYNSIGFGLGTHPIMRSTDMEEWEYVTEIPLGFGQSENPLFYDNGYLYSISRIHCYLSRYDIANDEWKKLFLGDQDTGNTMQYRSRGAIAVYDGYIYTIQTWGSPKINGIEVYRGMSRIFMANMEMTSFSYLDWISDQGGNYFVLGVHDASLYTSVGMGRRGVSTWETSGARAGVVFNHVGYYIKDMFGLPPSTYDAELEYLQGDGSAYINTGIVIDGQDYEIGAVFTLTEKPSTSTSVFGTTNNSSTGQPGVLVNSDLQFRYGNGSIGTSITSVVGTRYTIKLTFKKLTVNDVEYTSTATTNWSAMLQSLILFGRSKRNNNTVTFDIMSKNKVERFWIKKNSVYVADYKPVRRGSIGYMYDNVSGQLFGNANSTGNFIIGPDKNQ